MEVTLISNEFSEESGYGIARASSILLNELSKKINVRKIELKPIENRLRIPILKKILVRNFYFTFKRDIIKGKNVHLLEPVLLPKFLNLPNKKIVTVHDLYRFDKDFMKTAGFGYKGLYRLGAKIQAQSYLKADKKIYKEINKYDYIFARNEKLLDRLINEFNVDKNKISVSYGPIPKKFKEITGLKSKTKTIIGYINGFGQNKSIKLKKFIEEFKKLKDNDLELRIYGSKFPFNDLINNDERIKYLGFLPEEDVVETYNKFNVYLSTSTMEGFGLPIMQAKACKVPVLCYDGDLPGIVKRNTSLWDDNSLIKILENRGWEKVNIEKAYLDAEECNPENITNKTLQVYKKVFE